MYRRAPLRKSPSWCWCLSLLTPKRNTTECDRFMQIMLAVIKEKVSGHHRGMFKAMKLTARKTCREHFIGYRNALSSLLPIPML